MNYSPSDKEKTTTIVNSLAHELVPTFFFNNVACTLDPNIIFCCFEKIQQSSEASEFSSLTSENDFDPNSNRKTFILTQCSSCYKTFFINQIDNNGQVLLKNCIVFTFLCRFIQHNKFFNFLILATLLVEK